MLSRLYSKGNDGLWSFLNPRILWWRYFLFCSLERVPKSTVMSVPCDWLRWSQPQPALRCSSKFQLVKRNCFFLTNMFSLALLFFFKPTCFMLEIWKIHILSRRNLNHPQSLQLTAVITSLGFWLRANWKISTFLDRKSRGNVSLGVGWLVSAHFMVIFCFPFNAYLLRGKFFLDS